MTSSSSHTKSRPAAHSTRGAVFQCTPRIPCGAPDPESNSDSDSDSGQLTTGSAANPNHGATHSFASPNQLVAHTNSHPNAPSRDPSEGSILDSKGFASDTATRGRRAGAYVG